MPCRLSAALVAAFFACSAYAEPIIMRTLDVKASVPAPPWTVTAEITQATETTRERHLSRRGTDVFRKAYVPKGQDFDNWDEQYVIKAETPLSGSAELHRNEIAQRYQANCQNAVLAPVLQEDKRHLFVLFCPAYLDEPERGEYAVMVYSKAKDTLVQVLYQKRVPAYDINDIRSLPSSQDELGALVRYMNQSHLLPS